MFILFVKLDIPGCFVQPIFTILGKVVHKQEIQEQGITTPSSV